jgi:hypothetical protein
MTFMPSFRSGPAQRDPASARQDLSGGPILAWDPIEGARSYLLQISPKPDFSNLLMDESMESARYEWKDVRPGHFFWRIRATNQSGVRSNFSSLGEMDIRAGTPHLQEKYSMSHRSGDASPLAAAVDWPAVPLAEHYLVQWGASRDLAGAKKQVVNGPAAQLALDQPQLHYLRVAVAGPSGEQASEFSKVSQLEVKTQAVLAVPRVLSPPSGAKILGGGSGAEIPIVFSWSRVDSAKRYTLEISDSEAFASSIVRQTTSGNRWVVKTGIPRGRLYWRVRAETQDGQSDWSAPSAFDFQ